MRVDLHVTSGSRAGQRELFDKSVITIGRHPMNDFRFHPELDPDVSSKHAEIRLLESTATIHDLNSTNGTFVNGQRVEGSRGLFNGDVLAFGADGPRAEFRVVTQVAAPAPPATRLGKATPDVGQAGVRSPESGGGKPEPVGVSTKPSGGKAPPRRDTTMRIAEAVQEHTGKLRNMVMALAALVVVGVGGAWWVAHRDSAKAQAQIDALLKRNDSLSAAFDRSVSSMKGKVAALDSALMMSKADGDRLRAKIRSEMASGDETKVGELTAQLNAVEGRQRALVGAAQVDYPSINAKNSPAIVFLAVEEANGENQSGSGFNVSSSGLVITNKHVVQDEKGQPAKRLLVAFEGTTGQWKKAHVVKVSPTDELAFIKIDEGGGYPVVAGVAKDGAIRVGAPVAIIGYPLGTGTAGNGGDITRLRPTSTMTVGTVSKTLADILQIDGYAAQGSSGSAIFDARGFVVGVLYGGPTEAAGRIVYAVPAAKLVAQMPPEGAGIVR